jgi:hypothetical protein
MPDYRTSALTPELARKRFSYPVVGVGTSRCPPTRRRDMPLACASPSCPSLGQRAGL